MTMFMARRVAMQPSGWPLSLHDEIMADDPTGYWRGDGITPSVGEHLPDSSGNGLYMTLWNNGGSASSFPRQVSSLIPSDPVDPAIEFATNSNFWNPDHWPALDFTTGMSLEFWMKYTDPPLASFNHDLVKKGSVWGTQLNYTGDGTSFLLAGYARRTVGGTPFVTHPVVEDTTYYVAMTYDGADLLLYVDGVQVGSLAHPGVLDPDSGVNMVFALNSDFRETFVGVLDEIAIYDHALSAERVSAHYHAGIGL